MNNYKTPYAVRSENFDENHLAFRSFFCVYVGSMISLYTGSGYDGSTAVVHGGATCRRISIPPEKLRPPPLETLSREPV